MNPYAILGTLALVGVLVGGASWKAYNLGQADIQADWDAAKAEAAEQEKKDREEGFAIAAEYESQLTVMRNRYAQAVAARSAALKQPFVCPPSGQIGDVIVPAATVRSMFNIQAASAPSAAASQPPR